MSNVTLDIEAWIDLLPEPMLVINAQGTIVAINSKGREFFGGHVLNRNLRELVATPPEKLNKWLPLWQQATQMVPGTLQGHQGQKIEVEAVGIHRCQPPLILLRLFRQPRFLRQFIVQREQFQHLQQQMARQTALIVKLQQRQKQLEAENHHLQGVSQQDSLTKLANRRAFEAHLESAWRESATTIPPLPLPYWILITLSATTIPMVIWRAIAPCNGLPKPLNPNYERPIWWLAMAVKSLFSCCARPTMTLLFVL